MKDKFRVWVQKTSLNQLPSQPTRGHWGLRRLPLQSAASCSFSCLAPFPPVVLCLPLGLTFQTFLCFLSLTQDSDSFPLMKGAEGGVSLLRHLSSAPTKEVCPPSSSADSGNGFYQPTCTYPATQISFLGA